MSAEFKVAIIGICLIAFGLLMIYIGGSPKIRWSYCKVFASIGLCMIALGAIAMISSYVSAQAKQEQLPKPAPTENR